MLKKLLHLFQIEKIPAPGAYFYNKVAAHSAIMRDFYGKVADEILNEISSGNILDVGTGPGYLPVMLAQRNEALKLTGIDLSPAMIKIARKNARKAGVEERVDFKVASAYDLPFPNETFDAVISTASLHHWHRAEKAFEEIYRVLKKGGKAFIYDINGELPKDIKRNFIRKYGWFWGPYFLYVVRAHSSITKKEIESILSRLTVSFSSISLEEEDFIIKLKMVK